MTPVELIEQITKLPPNARISMRVTQEAGKPFVEIQVNIEATGLLSTLTQKAPKPSE